MDLLFKLRDAGNTLIIIEHNLDVIRLADWVLDLGPTGGKKGGELVFSGTVKDLQKNSVSLTGQALLKHNQRVVK
jgi:excinuclease ABC subunit A